MWNYLFIDNETGEYFFVQCDTLDEAWQTLELQYEGDLEQVEYCEEYFDDYEAEFLGYDTY